ISVLAVGTSVALGWALSTATDQVAAGVGFGLGCGALFGVMLGVFLHEEVWPTPGAVLLVVGVQGLYLSHPPRCVPWSEVAEVAVYEQERDMGEGHVVWLPQIAVRLVADSDDHTSSESEQPDEGIHPREQWRPREVLPDVTVVRFDFGRLRDAVGVAAAGVRVRHYGRLHPRAR
nr:hypothetical protein [Micromonospora sp. DSM 115978]